MNQDIAGFTLILVTVNLLFAGALWAVEISQKRAGIRYIYLNFILKALFFLAPSLTLFGFQDSLIWGAWITGPIKVSLIPVIYLYFTKLSQKDKGIVKKDLWHFIPLFLDIILTIIVVPMFMKVVGQLEPNEVLKSTWEGNIHLTILMIAARSVSVLQALVYSFFILRQYKIYASFLRAFSSHESYFNLRWFKWAAFVIVFSGIIEGVSLFGAYNIPLMFIVMFLFNIFYVIFFFIHSILHKDINSDEHNKEDQRANENLDNKEEWEFFTAKIIELEIFLEPELDLSTTAKKTGFPKYRISSLIKENGFANFYNFINFHRIEKSKNILKTIPDHITIESVAYDSGFKSRSTFFRVFKSLTGHTPTQFLQTLKTEHKA